MDRENLIHRVFWAFGTIYFIALLSLEYLVITLPNVGIGYIADNWGFYLQGVILAHLIFSTFFTLALLCVYIRKG